MSLCMTCFPWQYIRARANDATYCLNHNNNIGLSVLEEYPHDQSDTHSMLFVSEVLSCYVSVFTRFGIRTNHQ